MGVEEDSAGGEGRLRSRFGWWRGLVVFVGAVGVAAGAMASAQD
eukprot:COSAG02_NODE_3288_length_7000_cov_1414.390958_10_plen_44_part_00